MSGHYGQPGWDPQGQYPGQGPDYGYGPPGVPGHRPGNGSATAALICNGVLVVFCCGLLAIPGIITGAMAVSRAQTDPQSSRTLTLWSWVIFVCNIALVVVVFAILLVIGYFEDPSTY